MTSPTQSFATPTDCTIEDLRDVQGILVLLSLALTIIAAPTTPILIARVTAVMAQHTAMAWAELLEGMIDSQGGAA
jgi:hypothetical protein